MRRVKQIGVDHVLTGGPKIPWTEADVRARIERFKAGGLTLCNLMISGFNDVIWGGRAPTRRSRTSSRRSAPPARPACRSIEYNFYAHRLMEGYKEETGRAGAGYTAYDYELSKNLPPHDGVGTHTRAEQLKRAEHFLKAVVPEAEKANVRLALHPERSARAAQPRLGADHGDVRALEGVPGPGREPVQRHDVRLRRHARDGRGPGGGLPLPRRARPHQPRPLPQRRRPKAVRRLHRGVPRRRPGGHVRA